MTESFDLRRQLLTARLRYQQGHAPAMLVHESRILQVTHFGTLQSNMSFLDFGLLLPDVMTMRTRWMRC